MDKLKMHTPNRADENFKKLAAMFPNAVTETIDENGEVVRAIDKDVLMQEISCKVVDGNEERYQFTWPDKKKSVLLANAPINKTLRPCREESVDFDNTENLYIEGDNLEVLKLLQETYLGKIKMIYIDPPYNTGNDFVYADDYSMNNAEFIMHNGGYDEEGNRLFKNMDTNGRFHTDWLNMIYPRLKLAKDLLSDDGVIFISIDDNEQENLKKICNEIFGKENFIAQFTWKRRSGANDAKNNVSLDHEYVLCFGKTNKAMLNGIIKEFDNYKNPDNDPRGEWARDNLTCGKTASQRPNLYYPITDPKTGIEYQCNPDHVWRFEKKTMEKLISDGKVIFPSDGKGLPAYKRHKNEVRSDTKPYSSIIDTRLNSVATKEVREILSGQVFDYPKTTDILKQLINQVTICSDNDFVLDFFSGSATTAHAVMQLNAEDGGHRKFIMVQLPEETDEKSEAYKAGYKNICEIGKERIRRAAKKIKEEIEIAAPFEKAEKETGLAATYYDDEAKEYGKSVAEKFDGGFRVLKCDSSNMKEVYYNPAEYEPSLFSRLEDNIKEDRTPEDLLFQVMLDLGILLSSKIQCGVLRVESGVEYNYFNVEDGYLIACFDDNITEEFITEIAKQKPYYFVMRDSSMASDSVATNFEQIFAAYSPETVRKVL